ncbi:Clan SB, family S8, subtilisin-like serine peptidase [Tritrichomonas foetus]|uniref:Clan SB, family S8, subtilisin-like serine peptidase n=1 Tax=Tritrichomonas foetus TaxID=1144522 RepID=A0A1J4K831_9EUKA|nr:Clan SB, family S8, subtilisin-like serine peptidase [Tritrichomonas foetus]|eukprot:OHT07040.1 Clan SB, family S8, subtilisin-like serine peptidase [Tritrichomonas foetus]
MKMNYQIHFSSDLMLQTGWYQMYLNQTQVHYLLENKIAKVYSYNTNKKLLSSDHETTNINNNKQMNSKYLVQSISNWNTHVNILSQIAETYYIVDGCTEHELTNDPQVLSFQVMPEVEFRNRYSSGILQSGKEEVEFDKECVRIPTPLHNRGLLGQNQIINIVDSGIDTYHLFFYDDKVEVPINKTDFKHRKIVRYDALMDAADGIEGHGTHVSGTAVGNPLCQDCGLKMYKGVAPEAKVYFVDFGDAKKNTSIFPNMDLVVKQMKELNAKVSSNSWGIPGINLYNTAAFDKLSYLNPDILFVIAAGNSGNYKNNPILMSVESPADGKNVLGIGNAIQPKGHFIENSDLRRYSFVASDDPDGDHIVVEPATSNGAKNLWSSTETKFNEWIMETEVVDETSNNFTNKIMVINKSGKLCDAIVKAIKGKAKALYLPYFPKCTAQLRDNNVNYSSMYVFKSSTPNSFDPKTVLDMKKINLVLSSKSDQALDLRITSSKGPTIFGNIKPDLVAIGTEIISARAGDPDDHSPRSTSFNKSLLQKSGTSMSTPAISGAAALIYQYFEEKWYPNNVKGQGKEVKPSASLVKAILVNSARKISSGSESSPSIYDGYGIPNLEQGLGFGESKFRFLDKISMPSKGHLSYKITVKKGNYQDLRITMVYNDPVLPPERAMRYFADVNIYLISPSNKVFYGNDGPFKNGDPFATIEKIFVHDSELVDGDYVIHVVSSDYPTNDQVLFSLVVNGPITTDILPVDDKKCPADCGNNGKCVNGQCVCDAYFTGISCEVKVSLFTSLIRINDVSSKDVRYAFHQLVRKTDKNNGLEISFDNVTTKGDRVVCYSPKVIGRIADKSWTCTSQAKFIITDELDADDMIYFAFFASAPPTKKDSFKVRSQRVIVKDPTPPVDPPVVITTANDGGNKPDQPNKPDVPKTPEDEDGNDKRPSSLIDDPIDKTDHDIHSKVTDSSSSKGADDNDGKGNGDKKNKKTTNVIIGATIGGIAVVAIVGGVIVYVIRKRVVNYQLSP